jgi:hypothetical protein
VLVEIAQRFPRRGGRVLGVHGARLRLKGSYVQTLLPVKWVPVPKLRGLRHSSNLPEPRFAVTSVADHPGTISIGDLDARCLAATTYKPCASSLADMNNAISVGLVRRIAP